MVNDPQILTSDEYPLEDLMQYGEVLTDEFNADADRRFQSLLGRQVNERVFRERGGDIEWRQAGETEEPRTGSLTSRSTAFSIDEYNAGLGWTRNFIEDNPRSLLEADLEALVEGADEKIFEQTFDVMDKGVADGQDLEWTTPPSPGTRDFAADHNHVFDGTDDTNGASNFLFDDSSAHTPGEHIAKANVELQHHKYNPDVAFCSPDFGWKLLNEQTDSINYQIREARDLLNTPLPEIQFNVGGTRVVQTAELSGDDFYVFDTSLKPLYYNWVRPVEVAQGDGSPIQKPSDLIEAEGSARFGIKMVNPWAGVKVQPDNLS